MQACAFYSQCRKGAGGQMGRLRRPQNCAGPSCQRPVGSLRETQDIRPRCGRTGRLTVGVSCSPAADVCLCSGRFTMSDFRYFETHRTWEDWLGMLFGVLIVLSPWFPTQASHEIVDASRSYVILNTFVVGIIVFGLAQLEYVSLRRWEEVAGIVFGLWLIASPYMFGYSGDGMLRFYHSTLGSLVLLLAALQLWQDWDLSDQDMLKHGQ